MVNKFMNRCFITLPEPIDYPLVIEGSLGRTEHLKPAENKLPCPNGCGMASFDQRFKRGTVRIDLYFCEWCDQYSAVKIEKEMDGYEAITED